MAEHPITTESDALRHLGELAKQDHDGLVAEIERLREWLLRICEAYDMRAELYTTDADCAEALADRARVALAGRDQNTLAGRKPADVL